MPVKGGYLFMAGVGGLALYASLKGKSFLGAFRDVLSGQSPKNAVSANLIQGGSSGGTVSNSQSFSGALFTGAGASEKSFFSAMLKNLGAPATSANLNSMYAWAKQEEPGFPPQNVGGYAWNPLNIKGGDGAFEQWTSPTAGASGTAAFMLENNYSAIVSALRSGQGLIGNTNPQVAAELSAWSGGGYSSVG
jgi:hypothetical protein